MICETVRLLVFLRGFPFYNLKANNFGVLDLPFVGHVIEEKGCRGPFIWIKSCCFPCSSLNQILGQWRQIIISESTETKRLARFIENIVSDYTLCRIVSNGFIHVSQTSVAIWLQMWSKQVLSTSKLVMPFVFNFCMDNILHVYVFVYNYRRK